MAFAKEKQSAEKRDGRCEYADRLFVKTKGDADMNIKTVVNRCVRIAVATMALCCLNGCVPVLFAVYCLPYNTYQRLHEKKVDFSGRLIDQNGQPVAQAKVQYCIQGYGLAKPAPRRKFGEVVSNDDGFFDIHEGRGCELFIKKVEKRGYELGHKKNIILEV